MVRPPIQLGVRQARLAHQNATVVQTCVPLVTINGPSYRLKGRLEELRGADPEPAEHGK
jgi:hypothetical protein